MTHREYSPPIHRMPMILKLAFLFISLTHEVLGDRIVVLSREVPSYSEHGDDFRQDGPLTIKSGDCSGCELEVVVGVHDNTDAKTVEQLCPLEADGKLLPFYTKAGLRDFTGPLQFIYFKAHLTRSTTLSIKPGSEDTYFAVTIFLTEYIAQNNAITIGVHDFSKATNPFDVVRIGHNAPGQNHTLGVFMTAIAPKGKSVYSQQLVWEDTTNQYPCEFEMYAGSLPFSGDRSKRIFSLPKLTDTAQNMFWRMPVVTFLILNGTCEAYSRQALVGDTVDQETSIQSPSVFFDISPLYPNPSREVVKRAQSFQNVHNDQVYLSIIIRDLKGAKLDLQLVNQQSDGTTLLINQTFVEDGPSQLCYMPATSYSSIWTPKKGSNQSRYLVHYRVGTAGDWDEECFPIITKTTMTTIKYEANTIFFRIVIPIILFLFVAQAILYTYQYYRTTKAISKAQLFYENSSKWEANPSLLSVEHRIGRGAFSDVYHGTYYGPLPCVIIHPQLEKRFPVNTSGCEVAVKKPGSDEEKKVLLKEIETMKPIGFHPHLLFLLGCSEDPSKPFILTEFCALGDLLTRLKLEKNEDYQDPKNMLDLDDLNRIAWEVASALEFLAEKKLVHRDVAARNVLLTATKQSKLCDFGMSKDTRSNLYTTYGGRIPVKWTSPEAIEFGLYSEKSDVWAYGILLWEMYSYGDSVYADLEARDVLEFVKKGKRLEPPENTPEKISRLIVSCWKYQLAQRPCFSDLVTALRTFLDLIQLGNDESKRSSIKYERSSGAADLSL